MTGDAALPAPAVSARSVYRFYRAGDDETLALRGVSLDVAAGELVALVGPSGSGKSTLLSCLAGLDDPDGGTVSIRGRRMSHRPEAVRARMRAEHIGYVGVSGNLFDHLTVAANAELVRRLTPRRPRRSVDEVLGAVGLAARARAYPGELSGGESARAGLAVALAVDPAVVLADEPTGELDSTTEGEILDLLRETARGDVAVVVGSHSPALAAVADRVVALRDGQVHP
jgi:putative ABC transport system ATP-binding protein